MRYGKCVIASVAALALPVLAANPPAQPEPAKAPAGAVEYVPLGTTSFGPNGHGSYMWFIEAKTKQVVVCLVHNPQSPIECKRAPIPPA